MENWLSLGKRLMEGSVGQTGDSAAVVVAKDSQKDSKKLSSYEEAEKREKKEKKKKKEEVIAIELRNERRGELWRSSSESSR